MKIRFSILALVSLSIAGFVASAETSFSPPKRDVQLTYTATFKKLPESAKVIDLWLPVAQDTRAQVVSKATVAYPEGGAIAVEPKYGNKIWHKRFEAPFDKQLHDGALGAQIVFVIHRDELVVPAAKSLGDNPKGKGEFAVYLHENRLIPIAIDPVANTARDLKLAGQPPIRAARKTYDWLIDTFTYNWKAPGAGIGDVRWACDSKTGDCSDYHSMFIALMRNAGIAADHEFGFPIRSTAPEGRIPSYHCWARFYAEGAGWIPIDASEADKHPELHEYNFGSQSANLFKFTHGRDVNLVPQQKGPALNKFIEPYAEVDGVEAPREAVELVVAYKVIGE